MNDKEQRKRTGEEATKLSHLFFSIGKRYNFNENGQTVVNYNFLVKYREQKSCNKISILSAFINTFMCTTSDINNTWDSVSKILSEAFESLDMPSVPLYSECTEMLESANNSQFDDILKVCSKALTELNTVSKDDYNNPTEKTKIIARIGINFLSNSIIDDITSLSENFSLTEDDFGYIRDKFYTSDRNKQIDYFIEAVQPYQPTKYRTDSYNATVLLVWGVHNKKTNILLNNYVLEERQTKGEPIYLFGILDGETNFTPLHIYGTNLPMDVYFSTKLILIHLLNGNGKLAKYEISESDYIMIIIDYDQTTKKMTEKQRDL